MIFSALSGILLALAFPKFDLWWLAWVALVPFFFALAKTRDWKENIACGAAFGLVYFGMVFFWLTSLSRFVGWWVLPGLVSVAIFQTLFVLLFALLSRVSSRESRVLVIPIVWVAVEWLRGLGILGNLVGVVGYTQAYFLPLIQIASLTTVYGVSFLVVFFNAALTDLLLNRSRWFSLLTAFILVAAVCGYGIYELRGNRPDKSGQVSEHIALIQPNIDQMDKLNPRLIMPIYETQEKMTRQAAQSKPEIIIWPETAVFTYLLQDSRLFPRVQQLAREVNAWLIIGTPYLTAERKVYNSVVSISPSGEVISRYDKERLVPFGEYLPFRPLLYWLLKATGYHDQDFDPNPKPVPVVAGKYKIATAVCFESTFPGLVRQRAGKGSDFILTVTNDGWFGNSAAPYFHLNTGIFRAIENRKYFVQVGNTGFSAIIDPYGRILKRSRLNERVILF